MIRKKFEKRTDKNIYSLFKNNAMTQSYFDIIPTDLLTIIVTDLKIITILHLMATNKYLHSVEITYHKYLICLNGNDVYYENPIRLKWYNDPIFVNNKCSNIYPNSKICAKVNKWSQFSNICKYQYMFHQKLLANHIIHGFCTDIPINILQSPDFSCKEFSCIAIVEIPFYKIIECETFRQVNLTKKCSSNYWAICYQSNYFNFNIHYSSEIIYGRSPLYADNNIKVSHTTMSNIFINKTKYFISFYTLATNYFTTGNTEYFI